MVQVNFKRLPNGGDLPLPKPHSDGAAGMDLRAAEGGMIVPDGTKVIHTGFATAIPSGYEGQVRSRSGLAAKEHVFVLNSPGTIDADYRGELLVILHNSGAEPFMFFKGDRIAQLVIKPVPEVEVVEVEELPATLRGVGGLGSTGR